MSDKNTLQAIVKKWEQDCSKHLKGKTIAEVRYMTNAEQKNHDWYRKAVVIFFTDGSYIYPSADDEGNAPGALFTSFKDLPIIPVI